MLKDIVAASTPPRIATDCRGIIRGEKLLFPLLFFLAVLTLCVGVFDDVTYFFRHVHVLLFSFLGRI